MQPDALFFLYVSVALSGIFGVSMYSEWRRRRFEPAATEDTIFRCRRCGFVYTDDHDVDRSRCPQCGLTNDSFKF